MQLDTRVLLDLVDEANANWRQWCNALELQEHLPPAMQAASVATLPAAAATA
jgi:hypothetical protein